MKHEAAVMEPKHGFRAQFALWAELVKLRLTTMVLITTAMGFTSPQSMGLTGHYWCMRCLERAF